MRVAVVGAGVAGACTALELSLDGHEVTVLERLQAVAEEGSFAPSGLLCPTSGLASQGTAMLPDWGGVPSPGEAAWLWHRWRARASAMQSRLGQRAQSLAQYSRDRLGSLSRVLELDFEQRRGLTVLLRTPAEAQRYGAALARLAELGVRCDRIDAAAVYALEPALSRDAPLAAAVRLPDDLVGNGRRFAQLVRTEAARLGARWVFGVQVQRIEPGTAVQVAWQRVADGPGRIEPGLPPQSGEFDAAVICAGSGTASLLALLGLRAPMVVLHAYSLTAPIRHRDADSDCGPVTALWDERWQVAVARLGQRVRVAGALELGGTTSKLRERGLARLYRVLDDWFPGAAQLAQAQRWKSGGPALPDGLPLIGATPAAGVWVHTGHAAGGWAGACGGARLLADAMAGRPQAIDTQGLGWKRLAMQ